MTGNRRRPGVTLIEVLVATGILAIGIIAILALFPIGAVSMARAINQNRASDHGANSDAVFRLYWKNAWLDPNVGGVHTSMADAYVLSQEPMLPLLENYYLYPPGAGIQNIPAWSSQPGFPVLVDPIGWQANVPQSSSQLYVGGLPGLPQRTTLRRCININNGYPNPTGVPPPAFPTPFPLIPPAPAGTPPPAYPSIPAAVTRLTTLMDDMTMSRVSGEPETAATGQIDRGGRYNVSWLIQRPKTNVPSEVNLTVLVYAGRPPTDTPSPELSFPNSIAWAGGDPKVIQVNLGNQPKPELRKGRWIAFSIPVGPPAVPVQVAYPTLDFYRITAVNDDNPNSLLVELESPVRQYGQVPVGGYTGVAIVFENLMEVFDRGVVSAAAVSGR